MGLSKYKLLKVKISFFVRQVWRRFYHQGEFNWWSPIIFLRDAAPFIDMLYSITCPELDKSKYKFFTIEGSYINTIDSTGSKGQTQTHSVDLSQQC